MYRILLYLYSFLLVSNIQGGRREPRLSFKSVEGFPRSHPLLLFVTNTSVRIYERSYAALSLFSVRFVRPLVIRSGNANQPDPAQDGQEMAVTRCEHAIEVVGYGILPDPRVDIPDAEPVVFGKNGEGVDV